MKKSLLSPEQWQAVEHALRGPFGSVDLLADDHYRLSIRSKAVDKSARKFELMMFVNGEFKGVWFCIDCPEPEARFMRLITKHVHPKEKRDQFDRKWKKVPKNICEDLAHQERFIHATYQYRTPLFPAVSTVKSHLTNVCNSLEIIPPPSVERPHISEQEEEGTDE